MKRSLSFTYPLLTVLLLALLSNVHGQTPFLKNQTIVNKTKLIHKKENATYPTITEDCNFWVKENLPVAPWPKHCHKFQYTSPCDQYEISYDGKKIYSCKLTRPCNNKTVVQPKCLEFYKNKKYAGYTKKGISLRFPMTGKQCFFLESLYPLHPWPVGCKIYQAGDYCSTYEISDEGNFIRSCDLAMKVGQCISTNTKKNTCIEKCPDTGCQ